MGGIFRATDEHGPERLTTGKRMLGLRPVTVHCYRLGATLIDAGAPNRASILQDHLAGRPIRDVLLTHHHEDHVGLAGPLGQAGAVVRAPEATLPWLSDGLAMPLYRIYAWGRPATVEAKPLGEEVVTEDGTFEVIPTPGHSPEHVAFLETGRGWLFCGDAHLGLRQDLRAKEELDAYVGSLERMRELEPERLFPGHGPAIHDPETALTRAIDHFEGLHRKAHALRGQGLSLRAVRRELLGREGFMCYFTQGDFRKRHLVEQLLSWER